MDVHADVAHRAGAQLTIKTVQLEDANRTTGYAHAQSTALVCPCEAAGSAPARTPRVPPSEKTKG